MIFFLSGADESIPKFVLGEMICGAQTVAIFLTQIAHFQRWQALPQRALSSARQAERNCNMQRQQLRDGSLLDTCLSLSLD